MSEIVSVPVIIVCTLSTPQYQGPSGDTGAEVAGQQTADDQAGKESCQT